MKASYEMIEAINATAIGAIVLSVIFIAFYGLYEAIKVITDTNRPRVRFVFCTLLFLFFSYWIGLSVMDGA
jgi:hypothetical protein